MKNYSIALLLLIGMGVYSYSMEEAIKNDFAIKLAQGKEMTLSKEQFDLLTEIMDPDIRSMFLEKEYAIGKKGEVPPYRLPSVTMPALEVIIKNAEAIKNNDTKALNRAFKKLYAAEVSELFSEVLTTSIYLILEPILAAAPDFINKNLVEMIKDKPAIFKALLNVQKMHKAIPFFDKDQALLWAIEIDRKEILKGLIELGVDLATKTERGETPLILAVKERNKDIVDELINAGVDLNRLDDDENTALIWAAMLGFTEIAQQLIEAGADHTIQGRLGTPFEVAEFYSLREANADEYEKIIEMLKQATQSENG